MISPMPPFKPGDEVACRYSLILGDLNTGKVLGGHAVTSQQPRFNLLGSCGAIHHDGVVKMKFKVGDRVLHMYYWECFRVLVLGTVREVRKPYYDVEWDRTPGRTQCMASTTLGHATPDFLERLTMEHLAR